MIIYLINDFTKVHFLSPPCKNGFGFGFGLGLGLGGFGLSFNFGWFFLAALLPE